MARRSRIPGTRQVPDMVRVTWPPKPRRVGRCARNCHVYLEHYPGGTFSWESAPRLESEAEIDQFARLPEKECPE